MKNPAIATILAGIWISISEFLRNEVLFKDYWVDHYASMGLDFPSEPINGAMWGLWSMLFAIAIFIFSRRFSFLHTVLLAWFVGFILMWVVVGNMGVLPFSILIFAIPLSLLEVLVAALIIIKMAPPSHDKHKAKTQA